MYKKYYRIIDGQVWSSKGINARARRGLRKARCLCLYMAVGGRLVFESRAHGPIVLSECN